MMLSTILLTLSLVSVATSFCPFTKSQIKNNESSLSMFNKELSSSTSSSSQAQQHGIHSFKLQVVKNFEELLEDTPQVMKEINNVVKKEQAKFWFTEPVVVAEADENGQIMRMTGQSNSNHQDDNLTTKRSTNTPPTSTISNDEGVKIGFAESEKSYQEYKAEFSKHTQQQKEFYEQQQQQHQQSAVKTVYHVHEHLHRHIHEHKHEHQHKH